jgi:hypothetical protein
MNRFIEYSPSQKWLRIIDEDNYKDLDNPLDFSLIFYGTEEECEKVAYDLHK